MIEETIISKAIIESYLGDGSTDENSYSDPYFTIKFD